MADSAYIQAEWQGHEYYPLRLQPLGGVVFVGEITGSREPPDVDFNNAEYPRRLVVIQGLDRIANTGNNKFHNMALFHLRSWVPAATSNGPSDIACASFFMTQEGRLAAEGGGSWCRALEAQVARHSTAAPAKTWGLEVGVSNAAERDEQEHVSVGIYVSAGNTGNLDAGATLQRCNTGILIDGRPGANPDGWDQFILCRSGSITSNTHRFSVGRDGNIWAASEIRSQTDVVAVNAVYAGGDVFGLSFVSTSSAALKENIAPVDGQEALNLLTQLNPVHYNMKTRPDRKLMGFVAEDVGLPFAVEKQGVDVMAVVATLTAVVRGQRDTLERLQARVDVLEQRGATP